MEQIFYHYDTWEDYHNGMYDEDKNGRSERIKKAIELLSNEILCYEFMTRVTKEWTHATEQNLSNNSINHQAFLGQTACSLYAGVHEDETREAWGYLTNIQRYKANKVADLVYKEWYERYEREHKGEYQLNLFDIMEANK